MMKFFLMVFLAAILIIACIGDQNDSTEQAPSNVDSIHLAMNFERIPGVGLNPFQVTITIADNGWDDIVAQRSV